MMLISSSFPPSSWAEFETGWMWSFEVLSFPLSSPSRWTSSFWRSFVMSSCLRKNTTPLWETDWFSTYSINYLYKENCILVIAKSRRSSSELGALSHPARFTPTNSRPIVGVVSKLSKWSRAPDSLRGSLSWVSRTGAWIAKAEGSSNFPSLGLSKSLRYWCDLFKYFIRCLRYGGFADRRCHYDR